MGCISGTAESYEQAPVVRGSLSPEQVKHPTAHLGFLAGAERAILVIS